MGWRIFNWLNCSIRDLLRVAEADDAVTDAIKDAISKIGWMLERLLLVLSSVLAYAGLRLVVQETGSVTIGIFSVFVALATSAYVSALFGGLMLILARKVKIGRHNVIFVILLITSFFVALWLGEQVVLASEVFMKQKIGF